MMFLLFTCFAVPYQLAFDTPPGNIMTPYNSFDVLVDCLFMLDVLVNFFTSYYSQGTYVDDFRSIALNYCSTWFAIDVAGSFPFDKVILAMGTSNSTADLSSLRILKAVRMLKLMRAIKLMGILGRLQVMRRALGPYSNATSRRQAHLHAMCMDIAFAKRPMALATHPMQIATSICGMLHKKQVGGMWAATGEVWLTDVSPSACRLFADAGKGGVDQHQAEHLSLQGLLFHALYRPFSGLRLSHAH